MLRDLIWNVVCSLTPTPLGFISDLADVIRWRIFLCLTKRHRVTFKPQFSACIVIFCADFLFPDLPEHLWCTNWHWNTNRNQWFMSLPPLLLPNAVFIALLWRWLPLWNRALYRSWEMPDVDRISVFGAVELAVNTLKAFQVLGWFYGLPSKGLLNSFLHKDDIWWPPLHPWHFSIGIKT